MCSFRQFVHVSGAMLALAMIAGCGGGKGSSSTTTTVTTSLPISVTVSPLTPAAMTSGATQAFTATVTNDSASAGVTWTASVGSVSSNGMYTAPTAVTTASA